MNLMILGNLDQSHEDGKHKQNAKLSIHVKGSRVGERAKVVTAGCGLNGLAVVGVVTDTSCPLHDVGHVVLLMDAVYEMGHWSDGEDSHIVPSVCLEERRDDSLGQVEWPPCNYERGGLFNL